MFVSSSSGNHLRRVGFIMINVLSFWLRLRTAGVEPRSSSSHEESRLKELYSCTFLAILESIDWSVFRAAIATSARLFKKKTER
jgi:hypothetical protein